MLVLINKVISQYQCDQIFSFPTIIDTSVLQGDSMSSHDAMEDWQVKWCRNVKSLTILMSIKCFYDVACTLRIWIHLFICNITVWGSWKLICIGINHDFDLTFWSKYKIVAVENTWKFWGRNKFCIWIKSLQYEVYWHPSKGNVITDSVITLTPIAFILPFSMFHQFM